MRNVSFTAEMVSDEMVYAFCDNLPQSQRPKQSLVRIGLAAAINARNKWKPIETAPKDKRILVYTGTEVYAAHWVKNPITDDEAFLIALLDNEGNQALVRPTHWIELDIPEIPTKE